MKTVHKYSFAIDDETTIEMPLSAQILCLQLQYGYPCIWALVDTGNPMTQRRFVTRGTGYPVPERDAAYIGTYQLRDGAIVFHVFEVAL